MADKPEEWLGELEGVTAHEADQARKAVLEIEGTDGKAEVLVDVISTQELSAGLEEAIVLILGEYDP